MADETHASWDTRIERARQLAEQATAAKELLTFYAEVLKSQKQVYESLRTRRDLLLSNSLPDHLPLLRDVLQSFVQSVLSVATPDLVEQARKLTSSESLDKLLLNYWDDRSDRQFFAKAFVQPYAQWLVESGTLNRQVQPAENVCPYCAGKPQVSFLRTVESSSESGNRNLICATCLSAWEFRRVVCAACGEERPSRLGYFQTKEYDHVRIEACETCKHYLKGIDLTRLGFAAPLVDDVATAALDVWAAEKGYEKIELNLVGL